MRTLVPFLALLALLFFAAPAHADEADAADLVRQAKTAETVDRDVAKARDLYRRAMEAAGDTPLGLEATLALARLEEERGARSEAMRLLMQAAERHPSMDPVAKKKLQEWMVRLLPSGSDGALEGRAERAPGAGVVSPLERKIEDLLSRVDQGPPNEQHQVRQQVQRALYPLGKDVLPILERIVFSSRPERSDLAAEAYARIGGVDAVPGLVRAIREGDPFTREAATKALTTMTLRDADSQRFVEMVEPVLDDERATPARERLVTALAAQLPPEALMERHRRGGPLAGAWLQHALRARAPESEERALELAKAPGVEGRPWLEQLLHLGRPSVLPLAISRIREGGPDDVALLGTLLTLVFDQSRRAPTFPTASLDGETRLAFLDLLVSQEHPWIHGPALYHALSSVRDTHGKAVATARAQRVWGRLPAVPAESRKNVLDWLSSLGLHPDVTLFEDPSFARAYFSGGLAQPTPADLLRSPSFWNGFFEAAPKLDVNQRRHLVLTLTGALQHHPGLEVPGDARWIDFLALEPFLDADQVGFQFILEAAARSGDARYLDYVRRAASSYRGGPGAPQAVSALAKYGGAGLLEFLHAALADASVERRLKERYFRVLAENAGEEGREAVLRIARDWDHPEAARALATANSTEPMAGLDKLYVRAEHARELPPQPYRQALIQIAQSFNYKPAVRYLLREYRGGPLAGVAGKALDEIRTYHEKIESFERWSKGGRFDSTPLIDVKDLLRPQPSADGASLVPLLGHADPEVRRAAVIALGALGEKSALPRLVQMGANDGDESVRKAALEAVERLR